MVLPTETVYGLAASAEQAAAVRRLRALKRREEQGPLTVHIGRREAADGYVPAVSGAGRRLMTRGWPGPLTLLFAVDHLAGVHVLQGREPGLQERIYYRGTVGLRYPDCRVACDVINEAGCVVVASSANRAGAPPPTAADAVEDALGGHVDVLVDGGKTRYGGASTIVRVTDGVPEIVRRGVIDERTVRRWASNSILIVCTGNTCRSPMAEGLLRALLATHLGCAHEDLEARGYRVVSAGTAAADGMPPTPEAVQVLAERQVDISGHRAVALTTEMIREAQVILVMTEAHRQAVLARDSQSADKVHLLGRDCAIEDPIGASPAVYQACRDQIASCLETRMTEILL